MKNLFLLCLVLFFTTIFSQNIFAQYNFFVGGQASYSNSGNTGTDNRETEFVFLPYLGYNISENILVGLGLGYSSSKHQETGSIRTYTVTKKAIQIQPFVRYRKSVSDKVGLYGELGLVILSGIIENQSKNKFSMLNWYIGPGIDYALSNRWVVNARWGALSYGVTFFKESSVEIKEFAFSLNPAAINFSLNYLF